MGNVTNQDMCGEACLVAYGVKSLPDMSSTMCGLSSVLDEESTLYTCECTTADGTQRRTLCSDGICDVHDDSGTINLRFRSCLVVSCTMIAASLMNMLAI